MARVKVSFSQLAILPFETTTARPIFLVTKSFSLHSSLSLVLLCILLWASLGIGVHPLHLRFIVDPYGWFDLEFLALNTGWKVTESSVICIAFEIILNKFTFAGLLTVAKAKIMTVFRVRLV